MEVAKKASVPFQKSPYPSLIDAIAQRYGVLPSELLDMGVDELNWNIKIYGIAVKKENTKKRQQELANKQSRSL